MSAETTPAHTVHVSIGRDWHDVCAFLRGPRNFARWASWLGPTLKLRNGDWIAERDGGRPRKVRFTEPNAYGVADHCVLDAEDSALFVALRALPNGAASEVVATFFRAPGLGVDAATAQRDLNRLKALIEGEVAAVPGQSRDDDTAAAPASRRRDAATGLDRGAGARRPGRSAGAAAAARRARG